MDLAKGMAIILVVLFHSSIFSADIGLAGPWAAWVGVLDTFRMPLFFFMSGIFARKVLSLSFAELLRRRVGNLLWVYLLWSFFWVLAFSVIPVARPDDDHGPVRQLLLLLVWPNVSTWFVYALAAFFVLAWVLRRAPVVLQLTTAAFLAVLFGTKVVETGNGALDKMGLYFVFFLAAASLGPAVRRAAAGVRSWHALVLVAGYVCLSVVTVLGDVLDVPGVRLLSGCVAVMTGISVAVVLSRQPRMDWLRDLGTRTLPVYLWHFYPILLVVALLAPVADGGVAGYAVLIPPALTVLATLLPLGLHRVTRSVPGLYAWPLIAVRGRSPQV